MEFYVAVRKQMAHHDCNAFTIPCFEVCATRQLAKRQFTFCLAKSILTEEGIPAACAGDVGSVISKAILMAVSNAAPHGQHPVWNPERRTRFAPCTTCPPAT